MSFKYMKECWAHHVRPWMHVLFFRLFFGHQYSTRGGKTSQPISAIELNYPTLFPSHLLRLRRRDHLSWLDFDRQTDQPPPPPNHLSLQIPWIIRRNEEMNCNELCAVGQCNNLYLLSWAFAYCASTIHLMVWKWQFPVPISYTPCVITRRKAWSSK